MTDDENAGGPRTRLGSPQSDETGSEVLGLGSGGSEGLEAEPVGAPCWMGLTCDHLIENCPNRLKARAQLEFYGWWKQCVGEVDPDGGDLCGWCVRVWKARNRVQEDA